MPGRCHDKARKGFVFCATTFAGLHAVAPRADL